VKKFIILVCVFVFCFMISSIAFALFENQKIIKVLESNQIKIGMTKQELVDVIGYPPEGKPKQDALFYRFVKAKVTAAGKEESWTYQIGATADGVRSLTFTMIDGKVTEWNEWLDVQQ
jgi:hypothetical protein